MAELGTAARRIRSEFLDGHELEPGHRRLWRASIPLWYTANLSVCVAHCHSYRTGYCHFLVRTCTRVVTSSCWVHGRAACRSAERHLWTVGFVYLCACGRETVRTILEQHTWLYSHFSSTCFWTESPCGIACPLHYDFANVSRHQP